MSAKVSQPWIASARIDGAFIIAPAFISLILAFCLSREYQHGTSMPDYAWVALVLLIDVAHVYSTLYRTYFDKKTFQQKRTLLTTAPLLAFVGGVVLYSINDLFFWRMLAYLAVFHFVRQQYGFLRIYSRKEPFPAWYAWLDTTVIYTATLYPILHWHLTAPKHFNWLIEDDFVYFQSDFLLLVSTWAYYVILAAYLLKEGWLIRRYRYWNIPRTGIIIGTITSWYFGIVYFNGDLAFTLLNVVAHGIPYMALVWIYHRKQAGHAGKTPSPNFWKKATASFGLPLFIGTLLVLAYLEEGLWDALVWREHAALFTFFHVLPPLSTHSLLAFVVPFLALPQATHYILDGFIWKLSTNDSWKDSVLKKPA